MSANNSYPNPSPSVAIIVPTFARPEKLARCLEALSRLRGGPYRTVVVDDGSPQSMESVCEPYREWVQLLRQKNAGPAAARNAGARAAAGAEIVAFLDDDCLPGEDWIVKLLAAQQGVRGRLVGGRVINALPDNIYSTASQALCSYLYEYYQKSGSEMAFFTSNNLACRREDFMDFGGFDEDFPLAAGEDRDFGMRWYADGGELRYAEGAIINHAHDLTLSKFWRQQSNYGRGARQLHNRMDGRGDKRAKLEQVSFYLGLLVYPFRRQAKRPMSEMMLLGWSQVAMISGYMQAMLAERTKSSS